MFDPAQPEPGHPLSVVRDRKPRYPEETERLVQAVKSWIERDFAGNAARAADSIGLSKSFVHDLERHQTPSVPTLRALAPVVPDAVASLLGLPAVSYRRGEWWPNLESAIRRIAADQRQIAYARYLNDYWTFDRPTSEWARELTSYVEASEVETG